MKKTGQKPAKNVAARVEEFTRPVVEELGYVLWDIEFEKVGSQYELCVYIDLDDRAVDIDDCEKVSRAVDPLLDRYDPIDEAYTFYVSSAGLERSLKKPWHYERCIGEAVEVRLYQAVNGQKVMEGTLAGYAENGDVTVTVSGEDVVIPAASVAKCRLKVIF